MFFKIQSFFHNTIYTAYLYLVEMFIYLWYILKKMKYFTGKKLNIITKEIVKSFQLEFSFFIPLCTVCSSPYFYSVIFITLTYKWKELELILYVFDKV